MAALGFARAGFDIVSCGADERTGRGRTVALLGRSVAYLEFLGLWAPLAAKAAPLRALRLIDDTGTLFPPRPVEFHSSEIGLDAFGWNIENDSMADALGVEVARSSGLGRIGRRGRGIRFLGRRRPRAPGRRAHDIGSAGRRRGRPSVAGAARRRARSADASLSAERVDRACRP